MDAFPETKRQALARLLADEDPTVWRLIEEQFDAMDRAELAVLEELARDDRQPSCRGARQILQAIQQRDRDADFAAFCRGAGLNLDLEQGCWLLARTRYLQLETDRYRRRLDEMARELRQRLTGRETPRATIEVCNHYLFQILEFRGNTEDYDDPDNLYLNRVLDRRLGIPVSLSTVYLLLGQRLGLPLHGVNLPGHFIIKWHSPAAELFVDPFNGGQLLGIDECRALCKRMTGDFHASVLAATAPRKILVRIGRNLERRYTDSDPLRAERLRAALGLLTAD